MSSRRRPKAVATPRRSKVDINTHRLEEVRRAYLRKLVEVAGSQEEFARQTGILRPNISRALAGRGVVTDDFLVKIASTIGPTLDEIYAAIADLYAAAHTSKAS